MVCCTTHFGTPRPRVEKVYPSLLRRYSTLYWTYVEYIEYCTAGSLHRRVRVNLEQTSNTHLLRSQSTLSLFPLLRFGVLNAKLAQSRTHDSVASLDLYSYLLVPSNASPVEIKNAFRSRLLELHPDRNAQLPRALEEGTGEVGIREINLAWEVLGDSDRREGYDQARKGSLLPRSRCTAQRDRS